MEHDASIALARTIGEFGAALLIAFLLSRLGLYIRRSRRFEPSTLVGVHVLCFFFLGLVACSNRSIAGSPGLTFLFAQLTVLLIDYFRLPDPDAYHDDEPQKPGAIKPLGFVLIGAAVLLGIGLPFQSARPESDEQIVADFEENVMSNEVASVQILALKRNFPDEYRGLVADLIRRSRQAETPDGYSEAVLQQFRGDFTSRMRALLAKHQADMAQAPAPALNAYSRTVNHFMLRAQEEAPRHCAAFALGGITVEQSRSMPSSMDLPVARINAAMLDLARAGLDRPAGRDANTRPARELVQLDDRVRAKLDPSLREAVGDARLVAMRPTPERCAIAVAYYSAITELTSAAAAAVAAYEISSTP